GICGLNRGHAQHSYLDGTSFRDGLRIVVVHVDVLDTGLAHLVLHALDDCVGLYLESVLEMNFKNEVAASTQVESQPDIVFPVLHQFILRLGQTDDSVNADEDDNDDRDDPELE